MDKYIPQRPPIQVVDKIISQEEGKIICEVDWPSKTFFIRKDNSCILPVMVEMVAQTSAVMLGMREKNNKLGMLTAVKNFEFYSSPRPDEKILVEVNIDGELGFHKIVQGKIFQNKKLLAKGYIFLYLSEKK